MNRRQFNRMAMLAGGATLLGAASRFNHLSEAIAQSLPPLPNPENSGIEHIVAVTMENRSFDHFFGWMPNADGEQAGLNYLDTHGTSHSTHSLSGNYTGCPAADPDHSYTGARIAYNNGAMNGFLLDPANDTYSIGYYGQKDIPFYAALALNFTACDRYFASMLGATFSNRMFIHAAQTDRLENSISISTLPTIWDRLASAGISHAYYFNNVPYVALWGAKYLGITRTYGQFKSDAAKGKLPAVSFLDPRYTIVDDGMGNDDHPHSDIRQGDKFLYDVFQAVSKGPGWPNTVLIVNFDEWGGFFEHVAPPRAQAANQLDPDIIGGKTLLGMRVPVVVASPWSIGDPQDPTISSLVFDHTSVLKLIEWRWGLAPLTPRDASSDINNLAYALDFEHPRTLAVPALPQPHTPFFVSPCFQGLIGKIFSVNAVQTPGQSTSLQPRSFTSGKTLALDELHSMAKGYGFNVQ